MNSTKMLQLLIDGQASIRKEVGNVRSEMKEGFKNVNKRLDVIGKSVAFLEDDTPTREEHEKLEKRVTKIEVRLKSSTI